MPDKPASPPQGQPEIIQSDKFFKIYCNSVNLVVTPWDFTFAFGEFKNSNPPTVEQSVGVIMSPPHAKAFLKILEDNMREYEKNVGEIKLPSSIMPEEPKKV